MINTIQPRDYLPITRLLTDPADSTTYYLRAIIRDVAGTTIDTVNLAQLSGRLYGTTWQTPADSSGKGFFINVVTEVYTDSGRTVKSDAYGEELEVLFIYDRYNFVQGMATQIAALIGGPDGADVDYKKIRSIVAEELKRLKMPEIPAMPVIDHAPVIAEIRSVGKKIDNKEIPLPEKIDYDKILGAMDKFCTSILAGISMIPPAEKVDHTPVLEAVKAIHDALTANGSLEDLRKLPDEIARIRDSVGGHMPEVSSHLEEIRSSLKEFLYALPQHTKQPEKGPRRELNNFGKIIERTQ